MLRYSVLSGALTQDGLLRGRGYSGSLSGRNNPAFEADAEQGPVPRGRYDIGALRLSDSLGEKVMNLTPQEGTDTFGRVGLRIHGDASEEDGFRGIVMPTSLREWIAASGETTIEVF